MDSYPVVAEEVVRMYGYEHVVPTFMPDALVTMGGLNQKQKKELKLKKALCSVGAYECIHYSFFSPTDLDLLRLPEDAAERNAIRILNPINEDLSLMRTTLAASMLNAMARNQKKGNLSGRLYELGKKFIADKLPLDDYPDERETLCIGVFGDNESFFTLKGMAEKTAEALYLKFEYEQGTKSFLHPYQTAKIFCQGTEIGYLGKVAYEVAEELDLRTAAYIMEIDMKTIASLQAGKANFKPLSKFSDEYRDLALVMDKNISCGAVEEAIAKSCSYIESTKLFDVYEGEQIPADKKSMAFKVHFVPGEEAFEQDAVDRFVKKILKNLKNHLDIDLRQ